MRAFGEGRGMRGVMEVDAGVGDVDQRLLDQGEVSWSCSLSFEVLEGHMLLSSSSSSLIMS